MVRPKDRNRAANLDREIQAFSNTVSPLPGIARPERRAVFIEQLVESLRRIEFIDVLKSKPIGSGRADPTKSEFDPIRAAIFHEQQGNRDESYWLIFLATHFSKHSADGWGLLKAVYGRLGAQPHWTWAELISDPKVFRCWLKAHQSSLAGLRFGNHRKYESIREDSARGLAAVIESYVDWVSPPQDHDSKITSVVGGSNDPTVAFDRLFNDLSGIYRWGRLSKFDHLTMLAKVGLIPVKPGTAYLSGATGPRLGAALLLTGNAKAKINTVNAEESLASLGEYLGVGQQEMEDSLCNWQKSPDVFVPFR